MRPPLPRDDAGQALARALESLLASALQSELIQAPDLPWARNQLCDLLGLAQPAPGLAARPGPGTLPVHALERVLELVEQTRGDVEGPAARERLAARVMGVLTPRPSEVVARFARLEATAGAAAATTDFHRLCCASNYIQTARVARDRRFLVDTAWGPLEITINRAKPEKDPRDIAALAGRQASGYPRCLLCEENVGYAGRPGHPARQNLRVIPLALQGAPWFLQFSPYAYYDEHAIVVATEHAPIRMGRQTFAELLEFVGRFPHYFIGANAELPIVGGSILSHHHFQAGRHDFAMTRAPVERCFAHPGIPGAVLGVVRWPLSVLRLRADAPGPLIELADAVLASWRAARVPGLGIEPFSVIDGAQVPHSTVTPIARRRGQGLELDLVLRNNRCSAAHPEGLFHPHRELHHLKKENIGLIEVQGLAVLPGRLHHELQAVCELLTGQRDTLRDDPALAPHADWAEALREGLRGPVEPWVARQLVDQAVGRRFAQVLEHCGVFPRSAAGQEALDAFLQQVGLRPALAAAA